MDTARSVISVVLVVLAGLVCFANWAGAIAARRDRRRGIDRHFSFIPLLSIVLAAAGAVVWPGASGGWLLLVAAADLGTWSLVVGLPVALFRGEFRRRP
jgi:hypothetical protein